jgi:hypothetical protein
MTRWSLATACVAVALLLTSLSGQQSEKTAAFVDGELLLQFNAWASAGQRDSIVAARGARRLRRFAALDIQHVSLPRGITVASAVAAFRSMPGVALAQPNYIRHLVQSAPPNDPFWLDGSLWGLTKIEADAVWRDFTTGDAGVVIADIDTGVRYGHPDLAANMWRNPGEIPGNGVDDDANGYIDDVFGIDTVNHDSDPDDDQGHGTHTAGTIAAVGNNGAGVAGINWQAKVLPCKFIAASGFGTDAGAIECFNYIVALKNRGVNIRVSSNSWGSARGAAPPSSAVQSAIDAAGAAGIVNVFAAGNDGTDNDAVPFDPASYSSPSIVAVASSSVTDQRSSFSNYGATSVDLAAPGENILSTYIGPNYRYSSGTSMAAPHVAGVAALLAGMDPALTVSDIKSILIESVDPLPVWSGVVASGGRLNARRAAGAVGSFVPNTPPAVSITNPFDGAVFALPASITIEATAADADGSVQNVAFYANGVLLGVDATAPYGVTWSNVPSGTYTLTAVATDNRGLATASAPVHVTVPANVPPTVTITAPAEGAASASPATIAIEATAADPDGNIQQVAFFANGVAVGADTTSPYAVSWNAPVGSYTLTAQATDNLGATTTSAAVHVTVTPLAGRINVALAANGGVAAASSILGVKYPAAATTNGDRKGVNWGNGGGWNDGTAYASPDWVEVAFNGPKLVEQVDVFSMQDNYSSPSEPTASMTFVSWGLRAFEIQYWNGTSWMPIPGASVTANNLVWRQFVFVPLTTSKIRVYITGALNGYSRMMEVEAWGVHAGGDGDPDDDDDPPPGPNPNRINQALAANGGVATASSTYTPKYPVSGATNGDRKGLNWGNGGGWNDGTPYASPDWIEIAFNGAKTIDEVSVFSMQDNYSAPTEPTPTLAFVSWGLRAFEAQYWNGTAWVSIPGASVTNNNLVWRKFVFAPVTTTKIRVWITGALNGYSRVMEVEAWGTASN